MKKITFPIIACLFATATLAQQAENDSTMLSRMTKVQLADVYLKEVQRINQSLVYLTFDSISADVPATKYTQAKFDKVKKKAEVYNATILKELMEIIPYSDKKDILDSIMYLKQL
jgi:hypothetical protein